MASGEYLKGVEQKGLGNVNMESDTIVLIPMATSHTFDFTNDAFISDITADIASGATKITLANVTYNIDTANNRVELDFDDVSEATQTFTTDKFIIAKDTGNDATSPLLVGIEHTSVSPNGGTYAVTVPAEGIMQKTAN